MRRYTAFPMPLIWVCLLVLMTAAPAFSWTLELMKAAEAVSAGTAEPHQKALVFKHNSEINQMRIKGAEIIELVDGQKIRHAMSDAVYQKCQQVYAEKNAEIAKKAAAEHGAEMAVQKRDLAKPWDAGTDSDYITDAKSADQVKKIREAYNRMAAEYLKDGGVDPGDVDYAKKNDVDFMADPKGVPKAEFEKIAVENNDAYKRPEAAAYEAKSRSGEAPSFDEIIAYKDEMDDFVQKKTGEIEEISKQLRDHQKQYADPASEPRDVYEKRMALEAKLQQKQAQKSKYHDRAQNATLEMAKQAGDAGVKPSDQSDLPAEGKKRAPSADVTQKQRQITSATADAASGHLAYLDTLNETRVLGQLANRNPDKIADYKQRILQKSEGLTPSQKGEIIARLQETGASEKLVKEVLQEMQKPSEPTGADDALRLKPPESPGEVGKQTAADPSGKAKTPEVVSEWIKTGTAPKTPRLQRTGDAAGIIGDLMSIQDSLEKAEQGQHLFINIEQGDSEAVKNLKKTAVAALELAPIPIIDALERGWAVDEEEKRYILEQIKQGKTVNPVTSFLRVTGKTVWRSVASMTVDPLILGYDAAVEGKNMAGDIWQNWEDDEIRATSAQLQDRKFEEIIARAGKMDLAFILARRNAYDGPLLIGEVRPGDVLAFQLEKNDRWTDAYQSRWEIAGPKKQNLGQTGQVPASSPKANRLKFKCEDFPPGPYTVTFRMFDAASKEQMDFRTYAFTVAEPEEIGLGPIAATLETFDGPALGDSARVGDILAFQVKRIGKWDDTHQVEWLVNGQTYKKQPASDPKIHMLRFDSDGLSPGRYQVAVRALAGKKIVAHEKVGFTLKSESAVTALPEFSIRASVGDFGGPPPAGPVQNGDRLCFQADVEHPQADPKPVTNLYWQIYDGNGKAIKGLSRQVQAYESGAVKTYRYDVLLKDMENGTYTVGLTHYLADDPKVKTQSAYPFKVFQPIRIERLVVADSAEGTRHMEALYPDQDAYLFVYYRLGEGIDTIRAELSVQDAESGGVIEQLIDAARPRKEGPADQRVGLLLPKGKVKLGQKVIFSAALTAAGGSIQKESTAFTVEPYRISLDMPNRLASGDSGQFRIQVPEKFTPPFEVDLNPTTGLSLGHTPGQLSGTLSGISQDRPLSAELYVTVTDSEGRVGKAEGRVAIQPKEAEPVFQEPTAPKSTHGAAKPGQTPAYTKPPASKTVVDYRAELTFNNFQTCTAHASGHPGAGQTVQVDFCGMTGYASPAEVARVRNCVNAQNSFLKSLTLTIRYSDGTSQTRTDCSAKYLLSQIGAGTPGKSGQPPASRGSSSMSPEAAQKPEQEAMLQRGLAQYNQWELNILNQLFPDCMGAIKGNMMREHKNKQVTTVAAWRNARMNHQGYWPSHILRAFGGKESRAGELQEIKAREVRKVLEETENWSQKLQWDACTEQMAGNAQRLGIAYKVPFWDGSQGDKKTELVENMIKNTPKCKEGYTISIYYKRFEFNRTEWRWSHHMMKQCPTYRADSHNTQKTDTVRLGNQLYYVDEQTKRTIQKLMPSAAYYKITLNNAIVHQQGSPPKK